MIFDSPERQTFDLHEREKLFQASQMSMYMNNCVWREKPENEANDVHSYHKCYLPNLSSNLDTCIHVYYINVYTCTCFNER